MAKKELKEILQDLDKQKNIDPRGMMDLVLGLPAQMEEAWKIGEEAPLPELKQVDSILFAGLGGSAIGGDIFRTLLSDVLKVPVIVNRDYDIPAFVNDRTLVFTVSYSGNTEETLSAFSQAREKNATIIALTSNGQLSKEAERFDFPVIKIPAGLPPRAAIGYTFIPVIVVAQRLGLIDDLQKDFAEMVEILKEMKEELKPGVENNLAKEIALALYERMPVIYGSQGWKGIVAQRWKCQFNENSKAFAHWNEYPELNHNETVGWEACPDLNRQLVVINLRDKDEPEAIRLRFEITNELIKDSLDQIIEVEARGESRLSKMFSLIYLGDFVSVYLAYLYGIDPVPVRVIDHLKGKLKEARQ